jgi:hypothetical protein
MRNAKLTMRVRNMVANIGRHGTPLEMTLQTLAGARGDTFVQPMLCEHPLSHAKLSNRQKGCVKCIADFWKYEDEDEGE